LVKELQSLGLAVELRYEEVRGLPTPRFTYAEEEDEDMAEVAVARATEPAPTWEAEFQSLEEQEAAPAPDVPIDLPFGRAAAADEAGEESGEE
jgi:hypothetical protein